MALLTVLSVSATFYKTVILQDFELTGVSIEFPTEESTFVWFVYNNKEYELELETSNYEEIITAVANEVGLPSSELDANFLEYLKTAYGEAGVNGTGEKAEEGSTEEISIGETESDEVLEAKATSTPKTSEDTREETVTESEI
jgi:hypothetical protein